MRTTVKDSEVAIDAVDACIVHHHRMFREGLRALLSEHEFRVRALAATLGEAAQSLGRNTTLVLTEYSGEVLTLLPKMQAPNRKFAVLADELSLDGLRKAFAAGADAFLLRDVSSEALLNSLRLVLLGQRVLPGALAKMLTGLEKSDSVSPAPISLAETHPRRPNRNSEARVTPSSPHEASALRISIGTATVEAGRRLSAGRQLFRTCPALSDFAS